MDAFKFEIWAHRGSHEGVEVLENTVPAFQRALSEECDGIELDVHVSVDGHVVVHHDECLTRLSVNADARRVAELTLDELSKVSLVGGHTIPTLEAVLELVDGRKNVNIEIKDAHGVDAVLKVIEGYDLSKLLLSSFSSDAVAYAAQRAPELTRVWISGDDTDDPKVESQNVDPREMLIRSSSHRWHTHGRYALPNVVAELAERGIPTYVWTVNDVTMAQEMRGRGVRGIFCDAPGAMRKSLDALMTGEIPV